mmetsp:Transcript_65919/g.158984  ORF Transcript_65919/g.158984 Transcript_65919/m.158984 type:complete len:256 (+) Transcript_65919:250-1017(+)
MHLLGRVEHGLVDDLPLQLEELGHRQRAVALRVVLLHEGGHLDVDVLAQHALLALLRQELAQLHLIHEAVAVHIRHRVHGRIILKHLDHLCKVGADDGDGQREDEHAAEHRDDGEHLAELTQGGAVAVADGGHRHDAPPHGRGDGGELLLLRKALVVRVVGVLGAAELCVVHHAAEDDHRDHHEEEDGHELRRGLHDGDGEDLDPRREVAQLEHAHDARQPDGAQEGEGGGARGAAAQPRRDGARDVEARVLEDR